MNIIVNMNETAQVPYAIVLKAREVSGDIVGTVKDGIFYVDQSDEWLFSWEKNNPDCYARRMQAMGSIRLQLRLP